MDYQRKPSTLRIQVKKVSFVLISLSLFCTIEFCKQYNSLSIEALRHFLSPNFSVSFSKLIDKFKISFQILLRICYFNNVIGQKCFPSFFNIILLFLFAYWKSMVHGKYFSSTNEKDYIRIDHDIAFKIIVMHFGRWGLPREIISLSK